MRRRRRISEFGFAEFLGASLNDAPQSARQRLAALTFDRAAIPYCVFRCDVVLFIVGTAHIPAGAAGQDVAKGAY